MHIELVLAGFLSAEPQVLQEEVNGRQQGVLQEMCVGGHLWGRAGGRLQGPDPLPLLTAMEKVIITI